MEVVYKITNKTNNKYYIGSTSDIDFRKLTHDRLSKISETHKQLYKDIETLGVENFLIRVMFRTEDIVEASRIESKLIRENSDDILLYNVSMGASGRRVFYERDIVFIRKLYGSCSLFIEEAYDEYYKNIVTFRAFKKVWHGDTFKEIMPEVFSKQNKDFHFSHGQSRKGEKNRSAKFTEAEVIDIRIRRNNGESREQVYSLYEHKDCKNGFYGIWFDRTWKHLL